MKFNLQILIPFAGTLLFAFNNCSKYASSNYVNKSDQEQFSITNPNTSNRSTCKATQQSGTQIIKGEKLNFTIEYSGSMDAFYYSCNNSSQIFLTDAIRSPLPLTINPSINGNYVCSIYGRVGSASFSCANSLQFIVADNYFPQPSPTPTPTPTPTPAPAPAPAPNPSPTPSSPSFSEFVSVHQLPLATNGSKGFKNHFNPNSTNCQTDSNGVIGCGNIIADGTYSASSIQKTYSANTFKIYIPKGATHAGGLIYLPQKVRVSLVVSLDRPPTRTTPLSTDEYNFNPWLEGSFIHSESYQKGYDDTGLGFEKMLIGQEVILVHPGGGVMSLFPTLRRYASQNQPPLEAGHWIYIRVLNKENELVGVQYQFEANANTYKINYNNLQFDNLGDPKN